MRIYKQYYMRGCRFFKGGGQGPTARKRSGQRFFVVFVILNLFYSLQRGSNSVITEKTILFQGSRGVQHCQGGGGGPNANFYRNL